MADVKDSSKICFPDKKSSPEEIEMAIKVLDRVISEYEARNEEPAD